MQVANFLMWLSFVFGIIFSIWAINIIWKKREMSQSGLYGLSVAAGNTYPWRLKAAGAIICWTWFFVHISN